MRVVFSNNASGRTDLHDGLSLLWAALLRTWRLAQTKLERLLAPGTVWRKLAEQAKRGKDGQRGAGARQAEVTVDALYSTANWLRGEGRIPMTAGLAVPGWRRHLIDDWKRITGSKPKVHRPRHTPEEMRRLFGSLHDARVDPRFALAFELGG